MYIWQRLAYPHNTPIIGCARSFSLRQWRRFSNNTAVGSAAAVNGPPKSTPDLFPSLTKKFVAVGRAWKHGQLHSDLRTVNLRIGKYFKAPFRKVVLQCQFRKFAAVSQARARKNDIVGKGRSRKIDAVPKIRAPKNDIGGKGQSRKDGAVPKVQVRKLDVVPKVQVRKHDVVPKVQVRKHDVVSQGQLPKTGALDKAQIRRHRVVDLRPGKSEVASAAPIKNIVEDESLKRAHLLDHTRIALASHCAAAGNLDHTLQPRPASTPDDEYLQRSPVLHDVPPDGKSSDIEVSPDACEASLSLNSTTPMRHVSAFSRRSGAAFFFLKLKSIRRKTVTIRQLKFGSNGLIVGTNTIIRRYTGRSPEEDNVNSTDQELSSVSSSKLLAQERKREQALRVSTPPAPKMRAATGRGKITPMRPKRRRTSTRAMTRRRNPHSSGLVNRTHSMIRRIRGQVRGKRVLDLATRHARSRSSAFRAQLRALVRSLKPSARIRVVENSPKPLVRMRAVGVSSRLWARLKKVQALQSRFERTPSPRLQIRKTRQNETTHIGSYGIEPIITKYIFNDEKKAKQEALTEKVLTGLDDLLYTCNKLQLRKPRGETRDNAVEWPSRRKYTRWQRVDATGQPLSEAHEDHCAAETAESNLQAIVKPQLPSLSGKLDVKASIEIRYKPEDVRSEASSSDGHVPRESVDSEDSDHQAEIELPRISLAYDLDKPFNSDYRDTGKDGGHV